VRSERLTCFGPLVVGRRVGRSKLWESDDDGADGGLASQLPPLPHERQPRRRLPRRIADAHEERQPVLGESSKHDVQLFFGLGDRN